MKILKRLGIILLIIIAIAFIYAAFLPSTFKVERSIVITSSETTVWNGINKFSNFKLWNPWLKKDSTSKIEIKGNDGTVGAVFSWNSENKDVGQGEMTISKVVPMSESSYDLHFIKPMENNSKVSMKMEKAENGVKTTWMMSGDQGLIGRLFLSFMGGMDKVVGKDFEAGLKSLKELCESGAIKGEESATMAYEVSDVEFPSTTFATIRSKVSFQEMPKYFQTSFGKIMAGSTKAGSKITGPTCGIYYMYDEKTNIADMAAAVPLDKDPKIEGVNWITIEGKRAHQINYFGDYKKMMPAYQTMGEYMKKNNLGDNPEMVIEQYITNPMAEKDTAKWQTNIIFFTK